jgi:predicted glycosyltransferase
MRIWIDITNTPHVNVLMPIYKHLKKQGHELIITARDFSETVPLLRQNGIEPIVYGSHHGKSKFKKSLGMLRRLFKLVFGIPKFDLAFSLGGVYTSLIATLRRKKSISFSDNDFSSHKFLTYMLSDYFIFPKYLKYQSLQKKYKIKNHQIKTFDGFKEDIYIADYKVDKHFLEQLPFKDFITIRPENLKAAYVPKDAVTIIPQLFEVFKDENILFLPRYESEKRFAEGYENIWYPEKPLVGLDVCYYTKAMLTGAGTFAREAALLGVPAVSFFPRNEFLTVDVILQEQGKEFKSRNPQEIKNYVNNAKRSKVSLERSKIVLQEVLDIFDSIINEVEIK